MKNDEIIRRLDQHAQTLRQMQLHTFDALKTINECIDRLETQKQEVCSKVHRMIYTLPDFFDWLNSSNVENGDYIVHIRMKYDRNDEWTEINEILQYDGSEDDFVWLSDWWEGQPYVEITGAINVEDVVF